MKWPFAKRGQRHATSTPPKQPDGALKPELFADNDVKITVWLPSELNEALSALSFHHDMSRPDVMRAALFEHLYGRVALAQLTQWKDRLHTHAAERVRASPNRDQIALVGKATEAFRLELPRALRDRLAEAASSEDRRLSAYCRGVLIHQFFGIQAFREWQRSADNVPPHYREMEDQ